MIITRAPVRISFFGGGTDYPEYFLEHGGAVLATAIDKYAYVAVSRLYGALCDYDIRVQYRKVESVHSVGEIEHNVFRECLKFCGFERDIEVHTVANLPALTGLGSSSTFTVSLLHALHAYKGEVLQPIDLAYEAIHIERDVLHDQVGCQDQVTAALGGFNILEFRREDDIIVRPIAISPQRMLELQQHLILVYTGIKRKATEVVEKQLRRLDRNTQTLHTLHKYVDEGARILIDHRPLSEFGMLLHKSWTAKRNLDSSVSNDHIDSMYQLGLEAGAWGGKLLGAGAGGFLLFVAPPETHERIRQSFPTRHIVDVHIAAPGSQILFTDLQ